MTDNLQPQKSPDDIHPNNQPNIQWRHPEKRLKPDNPMTRKPEWIRVKAPTSPIYHETMQLVKKQGLHTVCAEASCPNIGECWSVRHATFMIMGDICTRACGFCNVKTGLPGALNPEEPLKIALSVKEMGLKHAVITSVDRDDLPDGGAGHFLAVVQAIRTHCPATTIEILTPDFKNKPSALAVILQSPPDVFNHNLETIPRLYPTIRPGARYFLSLQLLADAKRNNAHIFTKSGLMVGLGESKEEIAQVMDDARAAGVDFLTIGQYLAPSKKHAPVVKYYHPDEFEQLAVLARAKGFLLVSSSPLTRSSHHADADFLQLQANRQQQHQHG